MSVKLRNPLERQLHHGLYLTDGESLFRVLEVVDRDVMLEDCRRPEGTPLFWSVGEVLDRLRVVQRG